MRYLRRILLILTVVCLAAPALPARAAEREARDVAARCNLAFSVNPRQKKNLMAGSLHQYWDGGKDGMLTVTLPGRQLAQGVMLSFYQYVPTVIIESCDSDAPAEIARYTLPYQNNYIPFDQPAHSFRIRGDLSAPLQLSRLNVLTEGALPAWVQRWQPPLERSDLQLIVCHPDDEVLWFGGLLPTYAGQMQKSVQVTVVHTSDRLDRRNELLDSLWLCGVTHYPHLPEKPWTQDVRGYVVKAIRTARAQVIVTQDVNGEYGNENHKTMTAAVIEAVTGLSADPTFMPGSAAADGTWQPLKLYVHLWPENESVFDWSQRLPRLNNRTGFRIAQDAFRKHLSQQAGRHEVLMSGPYDCRRFGLYYTEVGPDDTGRPDFLQHIPFSFQ